MNKLFFLLTKHDAVKTTSLDTDYVFTYKNACIDCTIINKALNKSFFIENLDKQMLQDCLNIKSIESSLNKQYNEYLDVHYEAKSTLADMLFLLKNKETITKENKNILSKILTLTAQNFCCPLTDEVSLKLLTACNKEAKPGYDLHFQICITKNKKTVLPWQSPVETLASLHTILLKNNKEVLNNLQTSLFQQHIKTTQDIIRFNKLQNRFFEEKLEK